MLFKNPTRYSQSWEDHKIIENALENIKDKSIVGIVSSGDNILNLLICKPKKIYGIDSSIGQICEAKLKITAIKNLEYYDFLKLVGYEGYKKERTEIFNKISSKLDEETYNFWKKNIQKIKKGLATQGYTEKKYKLYRPLIKILLGKQFNKYISSKNKSEKRYIFERKIDTSVLRFLSKIFTKNFFIKITYHKNIVKNLSEKYDGYKIFWEKIKRIFVEIDCRDNPYLYWFFTGNLPKNKKCWQPYLQEENYEVLKRYIDNISLINNDIYNALKKLDDESIDCFYISDIFDWMSYEKMELTLSEILRVGKNNAKIVNFVISNDKSIPRKFKENILQNNFKNQELLKKDRVGFYLRIYQWNIKK